MQRPIDTRVWDWQEKKMFYHGTIDFHQCKIYSLYMPDKREIVEISDHPADRFVVMQSSGMKDAFGNLLWESDIINNDMVGKASEVVFQDGCFGILLTGALTPLYEVLTNELWKGHINVVGNKYEHPGKLDAEENKISDQYRS